MRGRYKSKENAGSECIHAFEAKRDIGNGLFRSYDSEPASYSEGPNSPNGGILTSLDDGNGPSTMNSSLTGPKRSNYDGEKRYLGVRVKMPVRDMLNKIRIAKGMDPKHIQGNCGKALKGEKKRVNTNRDRRSSKRKQPTKSLEELAIIVEVLEEDLKASKPYSQSNTSESPDYSPEPNVQPWNSPEQLQHSHSMKFSQEKKMPQQATNYCMSELKLSRSAHNHNTSVPPLNSQGRCINDESDNMMPSPDSYMTYSPSNTSECQVPSPQYSGFASPLSSSYELGQDGGSDYQDSFSPQCQDSFSPQCQDSFSPQCQDSFSPQCQDSFSPQCQDSFSPQCQDSFSPQCQDSFSPQCQDSFSPQCQDSFSPQCQDSFSPQCQDGFSPQCQDGFSPQCQDSFSPQCQDSFSSYWLSYMGQNWNSTAYFWNQLQREESLLAVVSDTEVLATDRNGRTALHRVVGQGKRALGYVIAKRMAALNRLDVKDSEGKTALHLAAQKNQHLMVADLIHLGACVNEKDRSGKTCLHLSVENGYIRVLEVLKNMMKEGIYVDVEATDNYGLSVFQCAVVALNVTVRELERSVAPSQMRLHTLRKEQMMETLGCLLQMGSYHHTLVRVSLYNIGG
ncbi:NF-kappa-B inhibitor zeta isoform X2 [Oncorhynchus keta]|uniref:NF-kappa-B inhibitor zeta isoform X2 n=1 Tax=Oncorhynchus keta TaxID=8018 RepID=UPI00227CD758|nr:NF-kappa-B inhibitor zeta isoform X2 [Oncorhynchus keta]